MLHKTAKQDRSFLFFVINFLFGSLAGRQFRKVAKVGPSQVWFQEETLTLKIVGHLINTSLTWSNVILTKPYFLE